MARRSAFRSVALSPYRAPSPIIRIATPRAVTTRAPKRRGGKRKGSMAGGLSPVNAFIGAIILGMAEKSGIIDKLPEIPMVGRKGSAALALWYWSRHGGGKLARDGAIVMAVLAGEQFGREQKIDGDLDVTGEDD
jgi:hypothetical protein